MCAHCVLHMFFFVFFTKTNFMIFNLCKIKNKFFERYKGVLRNIFIYKIFFEIFLENKAGTLPFPQTTAENSVRQLQPPEAATRQQH